MSNTIDNFTASHFFLSNFYPCAIPYEGITYPSTEHAFQAAKSHDIEVRKKIALLKTPADSKKAGRTLALRPDWNAVRLQVMEDVLRIKFAPGSPLAVGLLATGDAMLIEGNTWGDAFWGVCKGRGQNNLGKILMKIRADLLSKEMDGYKKL